MAELTVRKGISQGNLSRVYADPYITRVGHDHQAAAPIIHPRAIYFSAFVDGEFVGAFLAIRATAIEFDVHSLLHRSGVLYSRDLFRLFLDWCFSHDITRVTAHVIDGFTKAVNFTKKVGFVYEGCKREACMQHGVMKSVHILGMTRHDYARSR